MKIVIDNGSYRMSNMGDISMLQVAVQRLNHFFPSADIQVFTDAPDIISQYFPSVTSISKKYSHSDYIGRIKSRTSSLLFGNKYQFNQEIRQIVEEADLVVSCGGGYLVDQFKGFAISVADILGLATKAGKTTAILGQGFGATQDKELRSKLEQLLPEVDLIAVREKLTSIPLLKSLGIPENKIVVTGDDAIELAYQNRNHEQGDAIGVNVRVSNYSDIDSGVINVIKEALAEASKILTAKLICTPILYAPFTTDEESDIATARVLNLDEDAKDITTAIQAIQQVGRCRLVITGSYHAGVFALSQGIPVVALASSKYYQEKFLGLADQFGVGCKVILLGEYPHSLHQEILNSIKDAWESAEEVKSPLLESAQQQIKIGYLAYEKISNFVG